MADSHRKRYSRSPSPWRAPSRSRSRSRSRPRSRSRSWSRPRSRSRGRSRSRSRGRGENVNNPGNTLYVTGLSTRVTERDLEEHFSKEGKSRRKRPRTPTPGHYLGLKSTRDSGYRGERGSRYRGGSFREDYGHRRSPRRSPYRGAREYSPRHSPPPYGGGRSRRDHSRSPPYSPYGGGSPDRRYPRGSR